MLGKLKGFIQALLQNILGYHSYLFLFSVYKILRFNWFKEDKDFVCFIKLMKGLDDCIIIDAGANVGYTSVIFANALPKAQVIAYEPVSLLTDIIKRVASFFKKNNIVIKHLALGNANQVVSIKTPVIAGVKKQGLTFVDANLERTDLSNVNKFLSENVNMVTLDYDTFRSSLPVKGIKIDVENFELFVLEGASQIMKHHRPIVMAELWGNSRKEACMNLMRSLDYSVKVVSSGVLIDYSGQEALNYFFIPNSNLF